MYTRSIAATIAIFSFIGGIGSASACNRGKEACSFKLFNNTQYAVTDFRASPARVTKWEENILSRGNLGAGNEININMTDSRPDCIYDFKFRFADGDELTRKTINVCKLGRYTLNE